MKKLALIIVAILLLAVAGCYRDIPIMEEKNYGMSPAPEEQKVHVLEPEEPAEEVNESAPVEEEKQLALGTTTSEKEEPSIISEMVCKWGVEGPEKFSFRITNIEDKKWRFSSLSYRDRETLDNPIVILNALQVTNSQLVYACETKTLNPGSSALCEFNLEAPENVLVRKNLRTGVTPLGSENENTLSFETAAHAAEVRFLCE